MPFSCSRQRCHGNRPPNAPPFFRFLFFLRRCMRCNNIIYRRLLVSSCLQFIIDLISNNRVSQYYCHDPRPKAQFSLFQAYNHEIWPPALSLFSRLPPTIRLIRFASFFRVKPPRMPDLFSSTADTDFSALHHQVAINNEMWQRHHLFDCPHTNQMADKWRDLFSLDWASCIYSSANC